MISGLIWPIWTGLVNLPELMCHLNSRWEIPVTAWDNTFILTNHIIYISVFDKAFCFFTTRNSNDWMYERLNEKWNEMKWTRAYKVWCYVIWETVETRIHPNNPISVYYTYHYPWNEIRTRDCSSDGLYSWALCSLSIELYILIYK